jgi:DNA-binding winged helix-turn-helix (wHTH) protein
MAARYRPVTADRSTALPELLPGPDWRRAGCGDRCERLRVLPIGVSAIGRYAPEWIEAHDAEAHEQHEAALTLALALAVTRPRATLSGGIVRTGPLALDLDDGRCMVAGSHVALTPREAALLGHFARRLGRFCAVDAATVDLWPDGGQSPRRGHLLRSTLSRLRAKLGPANQLISNRPAFGYQLAAEPYTGPSDFPPPPPPQPRPPTGPRVWARDHDRCLECGTTEQRHRGHGLCVRCHNRRRPPRGGRVGRPRKDATP